MQQRIVDLRSEQVDPPRHTPAKHAIRNGRVVRRPPASVDGIVVHQTACDFGTTPAMVRAAGGDVNLAKHRRALNVAAHVTAMKTGYAVVACALDWYVYNANALNKRILGLEIEGTYPGLLRSAGKGAQRFDGPIVEAAKEGLVYLVEQGRAQGMPIKYVWAHRQSSATRRGDPGEEIWRKLVLDYAVPVLRLEVRVMDTIGDGRAVPVDWDPRGFGRF